MQYYAICAIIFKYAIIYYIFLKNKYVFSLHELICFIINKYLKSKNIKIQLLKTE